MSLKESLLCFLAVLSCSNFYKNYYYLYTTDDYRIEGFETYVNSFEKDAKEFGKSIQINKLIIEFIEDLDDNTLGICAATFLAVPHIGINPRTWKTMFYEDRLTLIYHELGHCILLKDHTDDPDTIMYPTLSVDFDFYKKREKYLLELFN